MDDPAGPAPAPLPTPALPPEPASTAVPPGTAPSSPEVRAAKLRFQAKVAGLMMMAFGALFLFQFGYGAAAGSQHSTWESQPGGDLLIDAGQANATVVLAYANGTVQHALTGADGNATVHADRAAVEVTIQAGDATYVRHVVAPAGDAPLVLRVRPGDAAEGKAGLDPAALRVLWAFAAVSAFVALAGVLAFRLRGPRVALAGAFLFVLGTAYLGITFGGLLGLALVGTAVLCFVFIYRARAGFAPLRAPPAPAP